MNTSRNGPVRFTRVIPLCGVIALGLAQTSVAQNDTNQVKVPHVLPLMQDVKVPWTAPAKDPSATPSAPSSGTSAAIPQKPAGVQARHPIADVPRVFTAEEHGSLWAMGTAYKSQFNAAGASYIPFLGSSAPDLFPVTFTLSSATVAGQALSFDASAKPQFSGLSVRYERGTLSEVYDLGLESVEQSFIFPSLPASGELVLDLGIQTSLVGAAVGNGIEFKNDFGSVHCSSAIAIDANGKRVEVPMVLGEGHLALTVPAAFVAAAKFPLTIDPVITTFAPDTSTAVTTSPDVAYDDTTGYFCFTWEQVFTATDHDIYAQMHDAAGNLIAGSTQTIDFTSDFWAHPKVANNNIANDFLVVAEVGQPTSGTRQIWGVVRDAATLSQGNQFQIDGNESGDKSNPDVGGDPALSGPTYFLVVWQRNFAAGDQDVHARTVTAASTLNGPGTILIDNSGATNDTHPSVSKSDGIPPFATQNWNVVWQRSFSSVDEDIRGAQILWDGTITSPSFSLDFSGANDTNPTASSPVDGSTGSRNYLVAYQRGSSSPHNIQATIMNGTSFVNSVDLTSIDGGTTGVDRVNPSTDSDGTNFAVAYAEQFSGVDYDVYISRVSQALTVLEGHQNLAFSGTHEDFVQITSDHSGNASSNCYMATWEDDQSSANIEAGRYCGTVPTGTITSACEGNSGCPCTQNGGSPGGCPNSVNPAGALLSGTGNPSVSADSLSLNGSGLPATAPGLYFQGTVTIAGGGSIFGDGKRCAGGTVVRLGTKTASGGSSSYPGGSTPIHIKGAIPATGGTFTYQLWYRNTAPFCTAATFNLTNGLVVTWVP
jgi:hypothetical protein